MHKLLLNRDIYTEVVQGLVPSAKQYLWVVTADIKDMFTEHHGAFVPFLEVIAELVSDGVSVRLIHAKEPGPRFREEFDQFDVLVKSELFERILCPRVHTKAIVVDGLSLIHI